MIEKIFINEEDFFAKFSEEDKKKFLMDCLELANKPVFFKVYEDLIGRQMINLSRKAQNMDQLCFMRGTINGIDLFFEEINKYAQQAQELAKNDGEFDKFKVIEE
jgi:hypothetical protein